MRILQIDKFLDTTLPQAGGVGRQIELISAGLRRAGHTVMHFGCVVGDQPGPMPAFIDYTQLAGPWQKLRGAFRILHDFTAARKLEAFLAGRRIDVAHVHNLYHHLTPSVLGVLRRRGIPVVQTVHDYRLLCPTKHFYHRGNVCTKCAGHRYWHCVLEDCGEGRLPSAAAAAETLYQRFFRRYIRGVRRVICPTRFVYRALRSNGYPSNKLTVAPNAVVAPDGPAGSPGRDDRVLYVGRLSEEKGPDLMLALASALPRVQVTLLGAGEMMDRLSESVERTGLSNVSLAGHVPPDRLGCYFAEAGAVVVPSRCFEVSPLAILEGMAFGRCVVAPAHGPALEQIDDGRTGRLFRPGDPNDLARVVGEVLADPDGRAAMGRAAAEAVRQRHDPDRAVARLVEIYREAMRSCESP